MIIKTKIINLYIFIAATLFVSLFITKIAVANNSLVKYVDTYKNIAKCKSTEYSIPYEVIMGIAIVESGSGRSKVATKLNNHFAIIGNNKVNYNTRYRQYPNAEASYDHFCIVISKKKFFNELKGNSNYRLWISKISNSGYSERPLIWNRRVNNVIEKNIID